MVSSYITRGLLHTLMGSCVNPDAVLWDVQSSYKGGDYAALHGNISPSNRPLLQRNMAHGISGFTTSTIRSAKCLPPAVWEAFRNNPQSANIMYAHAEKSSRSPYADQTGNLWIIGWNKMASRSASPEVDFVLSCTTHDLGAYPVFIFTPLVTSRLIDSFLRPRVLLMVRALRENTPPERVFSVFAVDPLAHAFADSWTAETSVSLDANPVYYHAALMYCDRRTFRAREPPKLPNVMIALRPAVDADIKKAAALCHGFAETSAPFLLSRNDAVREAELLIQRQQLWVHEVKVLGQEPSIASIVAVTRVTETVAGITKVFTNPQWRSRGCAERLTRHVCRHLLETRKAVVLYVAHDNLAAAHVYRSVGFVGFSSGSDGQADSWKELGFDQSRVDLGHW